MEVVKFLRASLNFWVLVSPNTFWKYVNKLVPHFFAISALDLALGTHSRTPHYIFERKKLIYTASHSYNTVGESEIGSFFGEVDSEFEKDTFQIRNWQGLFCNYAMMKKGKEEICSSKNYFRKKIP